MYSDSIRTGKKPIPQQGLVIAAAIMSLFLWRFVGGPWLLLSSLVVLGVATYCRITGKSTQQIALSLAALATVVAPLIAIPVLWPCPLACQGVGEYGYLWAIPTWAWGMVSYAATLLSGLLSNYLKHQRMAHFFARVFSIGLALCAGVSCWFLYASWQLEVVCNHCLALHTLILSAWILQFTPTSQHLSAVTVGLLASQLAFSSFGVTQQADIPQVKATGESSERLLMRQVETLGHTLLLGDMSAPNQADLILDPVCPHCRSAWLSIAKELGPAVGSGDLAIRIRLRYNYRLESSRFAAEMLVSSAAAGQLTSALPQLIGLSQSDSEERLRHRWATNSFFQPGPADTIRALIPEVITAHLTNDMDWMSEQNLLRLTTPIFVLKSPQNGRTVYSQDLPYTEILETVSLGNTSTGGSTPTK